MLRVKRRGPVFAVGVGVLALSLLVPGFAAQATDGDGASPVDGSVVQSDPVDNEAGGGALTDPLSGAASTEMSEAGVDGETLGVKPVQDDNGVAPVNGEGAVPLSEKTTEGVSTEVPSGAVAVTGDNGGGAVASESGPGEDAEAAEQQKGTIRGKILGLTPEQLAEVLVYAWGDGHDYAPVSSDGSYELKVEEGSYGVRFSEIYKEGGPRFLPDQKYVHGGRTTVGVYGASSVEVTAGQVTTLSPVTLKTYSTHPTPTYSSTVKLRATENVAVDSVHFSLFEVVDAEGAEIHQHWTYRDSTELEDIQVPVISRNSKFFLRGEGRVDGKRRYQVERGSMDAPLSLPSGDLVFTWEKVGQDEPEVEKVPVSLRITASNDIDLTGCYHVDRHGWSRRGVSFKVKSVSQSAVVLEAMYPKGFGKDAYRGGCWNSAKKDRDYVTVPFDVRDQAVSVAASLPSRGVDVEFEASPWMSVVAVPLEFSQDKNFSGYFSDVLWQESDETRKKRVIENIPPGKYVLRADHLYNGSKGPFFYTEANSQEPFIITVPEGVTTFKSGVRWFVPEPGSISGRVRSAVYPEPLAATRIDAYRWKGERWNKVYSTSDWGRYTFRYLEPGKYTFGFSNPYIFDDLFGGWSVEFLIPSPSTYPYCPQFLGGVESLEGATVIDVKSGETAVAPDVVLKKCAGQVITPGDVRILGDAVVGKTLTAKPGTWLPEMVQLDYQWFADGEPIANATTQDLVLTESLVGKKISVKVTGSRPQYTTASAQSPEVTVRAADTSDTGGDSGSTGGDSGSTGGSGNAGGIAGSVGGDSGSAGSGDVSGLKLVVPETALVAGSEVAVSGEGFLAGETVSLYLHSDPIHLMDVVADAQGRFSANVVLPADAPAGAHHIRATGVTSKKMVEVAVTVTVPAKDASTGGVKDTQTGAQSQAGTSAGAHGQVKAGKSALAVTGAVSVVGLLALTGAGGAAALALRRRVRQ